MERSAEIKAMVLAFDKLYDDKDDIADSGCRTGHAVLLRIVSCTGKILSHLRICRLH